MGGYLEPYLKVSDNCCFLNHWALLPKNSCMGYPGLCPLYRRRVTASCLARNCSDLLGFSSGYDFNLLFRKAYRKIPDYG